MEAMDVEPGDELFKAVSELNVEKFKEQLDRLDQVDLIDMVTDIDTTLSNLLDFDFLENRREITQILREYYKDIEEPTIEFKTIKEKWMKNQKLQIASHLMEYIIRYVKAKAKEYTILDDIADLITNREFNTIYNKYRLLQFDIFDTPLINNLRTININYFRDLVSARTIDDNIFIEITELGSMLYVYAAAIDSKLLDYIVSIDWRNPRNDKSDIISKIQLALDDIKKTYLYDALKNLIIKYVQYAYYNADFIRRFIEVIHDMKTPDQEVFFRSSERKEKILKISAEIFNYIDYIDEMVFKAKPQLPEEFIDSIVKEIWPQRIQSLSLKIDWNAIFPKK